MDEINMVNIANDNTETPEEVPNETVNTDIQCHLQIVDIDTGDILVNQRG